MTALTSGRRTGLSQSIYSEYLSTITENSSPLRSNQSAKIISIAGYTHYLGEGRCFSGSLQLLARSHLNSWQWSTRIFNFIVSCVQWTISPALALRPSMPQCTAWRSLKTVFRKGLGITNRVLLSTNPSSPINKSSLRLHYSKGVKRQTVALDGEKALKIWFFKIDVKRQKLFQSSF